MPAPASGVLAEIVKGDGSTVTSGELLARIDTAGKAAAAATAPRRRRARPGRRCRAGRRAPASTSAAGVASPAAAKILAEKGVDAAAVAGTGRDGRVTKGDALAASRRRARQGRRRSGRAPTLSLDGRPEQLHARKRERPDHVHPTSEHEHAGRHRPAQQVQGQVREGTRHQAGLHVVLRQGRRGRPEEVPLINASIDGKDIIYHGYFDIGIAVGSPRGLVVPILRNADQLSIADIEKAIADFGRRAADGKLGIEEMTGGTFSISNGGVFGSMLSTPSSTRRNRPSWACTPPRAPRG